MIAVMSTGLILPLLTVLLITFWQRKIHPPKLQKQLSADNQQDNTGSSGKRVPK
jgi:hypothetical protein